MALQNGKWIEDSTIDGSKVRLKNDEYLRARSWTGTSDVNILKVSLSDEIEFFSAPNFYGTPTQGSHLVTKDYVLDVLAGLRDPKDAVRVASTGNIDIVVGGLVTIDGVTLANNDRVLLKDQTNPNQNGIYVASAGPWARAEDAASNDEVTQGMSCLVTEGTINARKLYVLTTPDPVSVGVTPMTFVQAPNPANFLVPKQVEFTLSAADITNGYVDLAHEAEAESVKVTPFGGPKQRYNTDYTLSVVAGVTRITFAGDLATLAADGDILLVDYSYATA